MSEETKPRRGRGRKSGKGAKEETVVDTPVETEDANQTPKEETPDNTKVNETPEPPKEETPDKPKVNLNTIDKDSVQYIEQVINKSTSIDELFDKLSESKLTQSIITKLSNYRTRMIEKHTEMQGVNQQYMMFQLFKEILEENNYGIFNLKFKLLNKVFALNVGNVFTAIGLSRYDYHWKWGAKSHDTYFKLASIITQLANAKNRRASLKTIDFNKGIENISTTAKQNLIRFYK